MAGHIHEEPLMDTVAEKPVAGALRARFKAAVAFRTALVALANPVRPQLL